MKNMSIGKLEIGDLHPCRFVAEVGSFFNDDIELALDYLEMSYEAGVDIFKTEILHNGDVCLDSAEVQVTYNTAKSKVTENYRSFIERKIINLSDYEILFRRSIEREIPIIATVFDIEGINFLKTNGGSAVKIARNNVRNYSLIEAAAKSGLTVIFDLGDVLMSEAIKASEVVKEFDAENIIFNYHPRFNPSLEVDHDLRSIQRYKTILQAPIGLSCHYAGDLLLYAAVGAGANLLEKGVDINPERKEADLVSACSFDDLKTIVNNVKVCSRAMGKSDPEVKKIRLANVEPGLIAKSNISAGKIFTIENVGFAWPSVEISAEFFGQIAGKESKVSLKKGDIIKWADVRF